MDGRHARPGDPGSPTLRARLRALVFGCCALIIALSAVVIALRPANSTAESAGPGAAVPPDSQAPGPGIASVSAPASPSVAAPRPKLLFGIGTEADTARTTPLARQTPVRMLTSRYTGPGDLARLAGWRTTVVPQSYAAGYALHLIVYAGEATNTAPAHTAPTNAASSNTASANTVTTKYGTACGRLYPLSIGILSDMQQLAKIFAGAAHGPPLYVTLFADFQTYPCVAGAWSPDPATTNYYRALKDQFATAEAIFHASAPNARVSLGWDARQARTDDPADGAGRSLFAHFADVMEASDFESLEATQDDGNAADIAATVRILGAYGPVMVARYEPDDGSQTTYDADMAALFGPGGSVPRLIGEGLFAFSFADDAQMNASAATYQLAENAVTRYAGSR
ncbi:MAG TPA: hypothetical protein VFU73_11730 [Actinocrinis sp.]|nr:hypothetical protein [Actinocrinis sp.]